VYDLGFDLYVLGCPVGLVEGFVGVEVCVGFLDAGPFVSFSGGVGEFEVVFQCGFGVPECLGYVEASGVEDCEVEVVVP